MNDEEIVISDNDNVSSDVTDRDSGDYGCENCVDDNSGVNTEAFEVGDDLYESGESGDQKEEYERLIKTKYKELFAEDMQRVISKRFKKYKALEEKVLKLELEAKKYADIDLLLKQERERAVMETEERLNLQFKANSGRVIENALSPHSARPSFDVSRLTKGERAALASRALKGEKIHF